MSPGSSRAERRSAGTTTAPTQTHWWSSVELIEWVALAAGLAPIVVALVWALSVGWVPLGDTGQLVVRSRDVFTANHPYVGAWSSRSASIDGNVNNLGALQLVLLAPFTRLDATWGAAVGTSVLAGASVVGVWASARSVLGRLGAIGAMVATLLLIASMGNLLVLETRQQLAMLLPFWCLAWASVALWRGRSWAAPLVVFTASLVVQTHFTLILQSVILAGGATTAFVVGQRGRLRRRQVLVPWAVAGLIGLVVWAPSLWDQFFGMGNLADVASQSGGGEGAGLGTGIELMGQFAFRRPFWVPGSMGRADQGFPTIAGTVRADAATWLTIGLWAAVALGVWAWARAHGHRGVSALAGVGALALLGGVVAADKIPPAIYGLYGPPNYYWLWPTALLVALAPFAMVAASDRTTNLIGDRLITAAGAVALVVTAALAAPVANHIPLISRESFQMQPAARSLLEQLDRSLDQHPIDAPVLITYRGSPFSSHRYTFLSELQHHGVRFTFDRKDTNLFRFGSRRCAGPSIDQQIIFTTGDEAMQAAPPGSRLLARTDSSRRRRDALARQDEVAGAAIRSGAITVDLDAWRRQLPESLDDIEAVLDTPDRPATGLAVDVEKAVALRAVEVQDRSADLIQRWNAAVDLVRADQVSLILSPVAPSEVNTCS